MRAPSLRPTILLVSNTTIFGGGEVYYAKLAKLLLEDYEIAAVVCNPMLQQEFETMGVHVRRADAPPHATRLRKYLIVAKVLFRAIRDYQPRLIHINGGSGVFFALILGLFKTPILITYHTYTDPTIALYRKLLLKFAARSAKKVICVSKAVQNNWRNVLGATNTVVISNWISPMPPADNHKIYDGKRPLSLLYVGRLEPEKGIFDLLQAVKHLENVHLDVVGDGSCMAEAMRRSSTLPVTLHGFKKDVAGFYQAADLFVLPSLSEGQSIVLIEAMVWGLPCLISDLPAPMETAGDGEFAMTYCAGDPKDLANKICSFQKSPERLIMMSKKAQNYARTMYSEDRAKPMCLDLIRSILSGSVE